MNDNPSWAHDSVFYHIYPLGLCDAPPTNDFQAAPVPRLETLHLWLDNLQSLGVNAIYLGPVFESGSHGYDTADYYWVDRRLGSNDTLANLVSAFHQRGMRVILDGVFNHTGRNFWAFRDVLEHGQESPYCSWFQGLRFDQRSPYNDPFTYDTWNGHYSLVKLNLHNPDVQQHLFGAVHSWIQEFQIDGLRLDAADAIAPEFLEALASFTHNLRPDFWLVGEVVHGDYKRWANPHALDSVTNYECYKGLYSSLNDRNYFEIAYALNRQFGQGGLYNDLPLYAFADNHDVNRVASQLKNQAHLYPLYCLLFTMPGVPSIYYGSEWGLKGEKSKNSDSALRPALDLQRLPLEGLQPQLVDTIRRLAYLRQHTKALRHGNYRQLHVSSEQFAFMRQYNDQQVIVLLNASEQAAQVPLELPHAPGSILVDLLNQGEKIPLNGNSRLKLEAPSCWARVLLLSNH